MANPADALMLQFLAWIAEGGRSYGEVMDAWRTSCPRLSIWEDALADGLVRIDNRAGGTRAQARVTITPEGRSRLAGPLRSRGTAAGVEHAHAARRQRASLDA